MKRRHKPPAAPAPVLPGTRLTDRDLTGYRHRNHELSLLGFASYDAYLESNLWRRIKRLVLKKNPRCYGCGRRASQVHHCSYSRAVLKGKKRSRLLSVCPDCHKAAEYEGGLKVGLREANRRLKTIRANSKANRRFRR